MPSLKDVKLQIAGVGKTKQITKAMGMVASAGLRGAQMRIERFRPYAEKFSGMLSDLAARTEEKVHPLLQVHDKVEKVYIVLLTSDRGLCGGFNISLITRALTLAKTKEEEGKSVFFICVGRKGRDAIRKTKYEIIDSLTDVMGKLNFQVAVQLGNMVSHAYGMQHADEVHLIYSEFVSMSRQIATATQLLPVEPRIEAEVEGDVVSSAMEYVYEPNVAVLLAELLPRYINVEIYRGLLDTHASENAARMFAMNNATNNCDEMIGALTLLYNKTRQAAITNDLMDIVGGANALQSQK